MASAMACDLARVAVIGSENGQGRASPGWRRALNAAGAGIFAWLAARLALVERA